MKNMKRFRYEKQNINITKKTPVTRIIVHVPGRINVDKPAHAGHHQQHNDGELIHL
jgi:hypothetical protein